MVLILCGVGDTHPFELPLLVESCFGPLILFVSVIVLHQVLELLDILFEASLLERLVDVSFDDLLLLVLLADVVGN